tara:strand:- start:64700 stop:65272 length:573 start_codon:yes stop_codon:yes gene_type:complete
MSTQINLLPWREELKDQRKKEFILMTGIGCMVALFFVVILHIYMKNNITHQMGNNNFLRQEIMLLDKQIAEIKDLKEEKEKLLARMQIIQELQSNRPHIVRLFDGITRSTPEGLFLTGLTRVQTKILIDGRAESNTRVSTFMRNIDASTWLKQPLLSLIQANEQEDASKMIGFNLEAIQVVTENSENNES